MKIQCDKCGKYFEVEGEWGYCPFCENDQVEVYKNQLLNVQMVSAKEITKLHKELAITEKALKLAVADKCKYENALVSTSLGFINGKVAVPKKEQWYLEKAKEMMGNE